MEHKPKDLQVRYDDLPYPLTRFENAQTELEVLSDDHLKERELFEEQYYYVKARFTELLYPEDIHTTADNAPACSSNSSGSLHSTHASSSHIKLPSIEIPSFDGTVSKWFHFRDTFDSLIIQNKTLQDVQRLHYLISSLKGEAKALISNLPITHDNFSVAWDLVTHRYNNVKLIAMTHVKQLLQLPAVKRNDATTLRHLINHISSNLNAIQALNLKTSTHDLIMNHLSLSVLDSDTHKEWEIQTSTLPDIPSTAEVIEFLEARCKALELWQANQPTSTIVSHRPSPTGNKVSQSPKCHIATQQVQCLLCEGTHRLYQCRQFLNKLPTQRLEYVKQLRACYNCLEPYNKSHTCSKYACKTCNKKHHTLLHTAMQRQSADGRKDNSHHTSNGKQSTSHATEGASNEAQTDCSFKNKSTTHVLLATAVVEVKDKYDQYVPCRVLLDSASQLNFITERCVQRLRLAKFQTAASIQGINNVNTATQHNCTFVFDPDEPTGMHLLHVQCCQPSQATLQQQDLTYPHGTYRLTFH